MSYMLEMVNLKKMPSVTKINGTAIMVVGAMVMTLYNGSIIDFIKSRGATHHATNIESANTYWVSDTIVLLRSNFGWSSFFILQSLTLKKYPTKLWLTAWIYFNGMVQDAGLSLIMVRDLLSYLEQLS